MEQEQIQIQFGAQLAALHTKVRALKRLLTKEQLNRYNQTVLAGKDKFLSAHLDCSEETMHAIDKAFK